jgi:palmitoyltransferase ZDHHC13/17
MGAINGMQATMDDGLPSTHGAGHGHSHGRVASRLSSGRCGFLMKLMGLDRFTQSRDREGLVRLAASNRNPFDLGCVGNCRDFWSTGREVGVDYDRLYEVPPEGFGEAKRRRRERMEEERMLGGDELGAGGGRKGFMRRMSIGGWGAMLRGGGAGREGYTPVRMDENV